MDDVELELSVAKLLLQGGHLLLQLGILSI